MRALVDHRAGSGDEAVGLADDSGPVDFSGGPDPADVVRDAPRSSPAQLRVDFGAHLEANYQRLVAQLYAITLDPRQAHDSVQDAYSRAWRRWVIVGSSPDPSAWIRSVAVRSTIRSWRTALLRIGIGRPRPVGGDVEPRTAALLSALRLLPPPERRAVVLTYMAGASVEEIAVIEESSPGTVAARLSRGRHLITELLAESLPILLGARPDHRDSGDHDNYDGEPR